VPTPIPILVNANAHRADTQYQYRSNYKQLQITLLNNRGMQVWIACPMLLWSYTQLRVISLISWLQVLTL